ncbi:hypothetical protein GGR55DRAFT_635810 [Xylaria sp. FL0064]|nr:hypothetical protein GGR55DRAFT_635810 [Xylaria sp. FL0064]
MEPYSGLEVASPQRYPLDDHHRNYQEPLGNRPDSDFPEAVPLEYKNYNIQSVGKANELPKSNSSIPLSNGQGSRRCGLPLRLFYTILAIVAVVLVGAIAGGVAGGVSASRRPHHTTGADSSSDGSSLTNGGNQTGVTNSYILPASKLSATNWTDPSGDSHRFVFFQDISSAIVVRRWDPQNLTWYTNNLTDIFRTSRAPINPLSPSTPLASASLNFNNTRNQVNFWYLAPDNTIASVQVQDLVAAPGEWIVNTLNGVTLETYPGSQLAAAWNRCWGPCVGYWAVAYQRPGDAGINVANGSNFHASLAVDSNSVVLGSSLALTPEVQLDGASVARLTMMSESLSSPTSGKAFKSTYETSWSQGEYNVTPFIPCPLDSDCFLLRLRVVFVRQLVNQAQTASFYQVILCQRHPRRCNLPLLSSTTSKRSSSLLSCPTGR